MIHWIIAAIIYVIGIFVSYYCIIKDWNQCLFNKIWFSIFWIALIPLYGIHKLYNHFKQKP